MPDEQKDYRAILKKYWGYDDFRAIQLPIIESICRGQDTLGLMPTGGGKSITFQVPTMAMDGLCLVITPLIALMKDQVSNLKRRGIKALALYSGMRPSQMYTVLDNAMYGHYKFLYVSPERLTTELFLSRLGRMKICLIAVDESHCISQWGYDFRPAYLQLAAIRKRLPGVPVLALTATATPEVVDDIQEKLLFAKKNVYKMSFERPNLAYIVRKTEDKYGELLKMLRSVQGSTILYVRNRRRTRELCEYLQKQGFTAEFYHAGLDDITRDARQRRWQAGESRIMVATNAFGMGIDKPDVRLVVHLDLPDSLEAYFQEAGRAGRDGAQAYAFIFYSRSDVTMLKKRVSDNFPDLDAIRLVYEHLQYYYQMAMGDGQGCIRQFDLEDFCRKFHHAILPCDGALKILSLAGYIEYTEEQDSGSRVVFRVTREDLYHLRDMDAKADKLLMCMLRNYTGIFLEQTHISEEAMAELTGMTRQEVCEILIRLRMAGVISYVPRKRTPYIIYTRARVPMDELRFPPSAYEDRKARYLRRVEAMIGYVTNSSECRSRLLLNYFGEKNDHSCQQCDVCTAKADQPLLPGESGDEERLRRQVCDLLRERKCTPNVLYDALNTDRERLASLLRQLLDEEKIQWKDGYFSLNRYGRG